MKQAIECMLNPPITGDYKASVIDGWQAVRTGKTSKLRHHGRDILIQTSVRRIRKADGLSAGDYNLAIEALNMIVGLRMLFSRN